MGWDRHELLWDRMGQKKCPMDKPGDQAGDSVLRSWWQTWGCASKPTEGFVSPDRMGKTIIHYPNKVSDNVRAFGEIAYRIIFCLRASLLQKEDIAPIIGQQLNVSQCLNWAEVAVKKKKYEWNPVKISFYRCIFHSDYNCSFNKPIKNECSLCDIQYRI